MAAKMELLKRSNGPRIVPRVVLDPSLSFSFQLPASLRQPQPQPQPLSLGTTPLMPSSAPVLTSATPEIAMPPPQECGRAIDGDEEDDWETYDTHTSVLVDNHENAFDQEGESWEDRDWNESADTTTNDPSASALPRVMDARMALISPQDADAWEEDDAPELPDDFPVLLVNLSRLRDLHFRSESDSGGAYTVSMDTEDELRDFYVTVKHTLHEHFTQMTEVLFEQEICIHAHYGTQRRMLENLHRAYPTHVFALIDYPPELSGLALHEYLHVLTTPTRWPSVNYLKDCLRKCSRDLEWKLEIAMELEKLAQQEHDWRTRDQQRQSDEIDALTRLRDSFRAKLNTPSDTPSTGSTTYLLLRKLEDIETRLMALLDVYLKEPALTKRESRELLGFQAAAPALQMKNVLDMVVAMIFSRLPRDYGAQPTREAHFEMLLDHHLHIRRLWKKDFGRLPVRSDGGAAHEEEEVEEEEEKEEEEAKETQLENDFEQFTQIAEEKKKASEEEEEEESDEEENANGEEWDAIADGGEEEKDDGDEEGEEEEEEHTKRTPGDGFDGYGADYESDDSGGEDEDVLDAPPRSEPTESIVSPLSASTKKRVVRRPRRSKTSSHGRGGGLVFDEEPTRSQSTSREQSERERMLEAFMYGAGDRDDDVLEEEEKRSAGGGGRLWNASYARTGALQLLRQAKENEGF